MFFKICTCNMSHSFQRHLPSCLPALPMIHWGIEPARRQQQRSQEAVAASFLDLSKNILKGTCSITGLAGSLFCAKTLTTDLMKAGRITKNGLLILMAFLTSPGYQSPAAEVA